MHNKKRSLKKALLLAGVLFVWNPISIMANPGQEKEFYHMPDISDIVVSNTKDENYAVADVDTELNIREGAGCEYPVIGVLPKDGLCYVESTVGDWAYISSGEVEGYVYKEYLISGLDGKIYIQGVGEENVQLARWIEAAVSASSIPHKTLPIRQHIVEYALQFVGNPYVWGGTSLTDGADCSGFVQAIYQNFGIDIPRISKEQAVSGKKIAVEEARPGDLIFYAKNGEVYHVVMYIGNGQVVHASSKSTGIKVSDIYYPEAVWAVRMIPDA